VPRVLSSFPQLLYKVLPSEYLKNCVINVLTCPLSMLLSLPPQILWDLLSLGQEPGCFKSSWRTASFFIRFGEPEFRALLSARCAIFLSFVAVDRLDAPACFAGSPGPLSLLSLYFAQDVFSEMIIPSHGACRPGPGGHKVYFLHKDTEFQTGMREQRASLMRILGTRKGQHLERDISAAFDAV